MEYSLLTLSVQVCGCASARARSHACVRVCVTQRVLHRVHLSVSSKATIITANLLVVCAASERNGKNTAVNYTATVNCFCKHVKGNCNIVQYYSVGTQEF